MVQRFSGQLKKLPRRRARRQRAEKAAWWGLTWNERLTLVIAAVSTLIALGGLAVAYQTYEVAKDSSDMKAAIQHLASLAEAARIQAGATQRQLEELRSQARSTARLVGPAEASARAALRGVKDQEENFTLDQRPRLGIPDLRDASFKVPTVLFGKALQWSIPIKNYGRSAAINIHAQSRVIVLGILAENMAQDVSDDHILPGQIGELFFTTVSHLSRPGGLVILEREKYARLETQISYTDEAGRKYIERICYVILDTGDGENCRRNSFAVGFKHRRDDRRLGSP